MVQPKQTMTSVWKSLVTIVLVAVGYYAIARLTLGQLFLTTSEVVPVWPAAGWAVASVVRWGRRGMFGVLLGVVMLESSHLSGPAIVLVTLGAFLEAVAGARMIERLGKDDHVWLNQVRDLMLLGVVATIAATVSASLGVLGVCWSGDLSWSEFVPKWFIYWLGDSLGIVFVTPVVLNLSRSVFRPTPRRLAEAMALGSLTVGASLAIFGGYLHESNHALAAFFPLLIWASLRFGTLGASSTSLAITAFALWGTSHDRGPFAHGGLPHQMSLLWSFLVVILVTTYLFSAILEERRRAQRVLAEREALLRSFYDGSPVMMGIVEEREDDLAFVSCNASLASFLGLSRDEIVGHTAREMGREEKHINLYLERCRESRRTARPARFDYRHVTQDGKQAMTATVAPIESGDQPMYSFVLEDVTERVHAQEELDRFFTLSLDLLCIAGTDGFLRRVNPSFIDTLGMTSGELRTRPYLDLIHPDDRPSALRELSRLTTGAKVIDFEIRCKHANGSYRWLSWTAMAEPEEGLIYAAARDVTDAKRAGETLREAKDRAEAATKAKSEFLANMSHELRTPLNAINGMAELFGHTPLNADQREYVDGIRQSADTLLMLVNHVLDFAKIEAGKVDIESVPFELEKTLERALKPVAYQAHRKNLEIACYIAPDVPGRLVGDTTHLQQVVVNLVSNAVKFTETGHVNVVVEAEHKRADEVELHVRVQDTGPGIPAERRSAIFESFVQADGSTRRKYGGTGLGLAICQRLVSLMRGRIWVQSEEGKGSTFHFTAHLLVAPEDEGTEEKEECILQPINVLVADNSTIVRTSLIETLAAGGVTAAGADSAEVALEEVRSARRQGRPFRVALVANSLFEGENRSRLERLRTEEPGLRFVLLTRTTDRLAEDYRNELGVMGRLVKPVSPRHLRRALALVQSTGALEDDAPITDSFSKETQRRLRILLADDSPMNRMVTAKLLAQAGHEVFEAANGREAVDLVERTGFDLILMDLQMPDMDGFDATARIRDFEQRSGLGRSPVIALTANASVQDRERCLDGGMDGYLAKPVDHGKLLEVVRRFCHPTPPRAPEQGGAQKLVDVSKLEALAHGDEHFLGQIVEAFLKDVPNVLKNVRAGMETGDWIGVERSAHRLKGSFLSIGAGALGAGALSMEEAARASDRQAAERELQRLEGGMVVVRKELEGLLHHGVAG